jgi:hypothetical protein
MRQPWENKRGWRQRLSQRVGHRRGKDGVPYSCPWWADEHVYALAFFEAKGVSLERIDKPRRGRDRAGLKQN